MGKPWITDTFGIMHKVSRAKTVEVHIHPQEDLEPHIIEVCAATNGDEQPCSCCPRVELGENDVLMVIHNAFDGREIIEELEAIGAPPQ